MTIDLTNLVVIVLAALSLVGMLVKIIRDADIKRLAALEARGLERDRKIERLKEDFADIRETVAGIRGEVRHGRN